MTHNISDFQSTIAWVADALIPSDAKSGMPSATEAGVPERLLPRALKERDDLAPSFFLALSRLPEACPSNPLDAIRALGADDFHTVSFLIAGAYFLDEAVKFCNERVWGTLSVTLVVQPASMKDARVRAAADKAIRELR